MASGDKKECHTAVLKSNSSKRLEKERPRFLARHRMHRSSVRPFFCCGSQLSLNSIPDVKEVSPIEKSNDDGYEDLTDSEEIEGHMSPESGKIDRATQRFLRLRKTKKQKGIALHEKSSSTRKIWSGKLRGRLQVTKQSGADGRMSSEQSAESGCMPYRCSEAGAEGRDSLSGGSSIRLPLSEMAGLRLAPLNGNIQNAARSDDVGTSGRRMAPWEMPLPFIPNFNLLYPTNDIDEQLIAQRRFEMEHGIDLSDSVESVWRYQSENDPESSERQHFQYPSYGAMGLFASESENLVSTAASATVPPPTNPPQRFGDSDLRLPSVPHLHINPLLQRFSSDLRLSSLPHPAGGIHTQVDFRHHLVPDLQQIINSSFYWGVMDRYQAEKLIDNKPEGTFLLRDSAQDEFLFSVSFRRYGRSLHARIEQWNHKFSFDSRDPGVFAADTVCGLIEHYKDPSSCMFFEPMLTHPLHRNFPFSLQHITRAVICSHVSYDNINHLPLPASLKEYLKFYHYKQKIRVRRFDLSSCTNDAQASLYSQDVRM